MNNSIKALLLALSAGLLGVIQGAINSKLGKTAGQYEMIIGVSLAQAIVASIILLRNGWGVFAAISSPWMILAGILGVGIMYGISSSIGSIGTLSVFLLMLLGQVIAASLIDHFGIFGSPQIPITPQKIGCILVIMLGIYGVIRS
ncbi:MAG: DMT family transporter [Desulfosporosinus sp.]|nr:DMT family transporter [Desulfosporosinus sp.]